jgi:hypothetical protein
MQNHIMRLPNHVYDHCILPVCRIFRLLIYAALLFTSVPILMSNMALSRKTTVLYMRASDAEHKNTYINFFACINMSHIVSSFPHLSMQCSRCFPHAHSCFTDFNKLSLTTVLNTFTIITTPNVLFYFTKRLLSSDNSCSLLKHDIL